MKKLIFQDLPPCMPLQNSRSMVLIEALLCSLIINTQVFARDAAPIIEMVRDSNPQDCQVYSVKIFNDGAVIFDGRKDVSRPSPQMGQISSNTLIELKGRFEAARFLELRKIRIDNAGESIYNCRADAEVVRRIPMLADQCKANTTARMFDRLRVEHGPGDLLIYRKNKIYKKLRVFEASNVNVMIDLTQEVDKAVQIEQWTGPDLCSRSPTFGTGK